ncbi:MAG TPA: pitrilysin family protein [Bdellovibrionota bacterium]|nr:pitrilysin family protein [Bdellovibrionota bacterium]
MVLVTEPNPRHRAIALGFWVKHGSRSEHIQEHGGAHFVEHLLFKGTKTRTPLQIAKEIEAVGGELNAFTSRETTCYHTELLGTDLSVALNIFEDILVNSTFPPEEVERERQVILEEIKMYDDTPDELVIDLLYENFFPDQAFGRPVLGTKQSISSLTRKQLWSIYKGTHTPDQLIVTGAGAVDHDRLGKELSRRFLGRGSPYSPPEVKITHASKQRSFTKPIEQVHVAIGYPTVPFADPQRYALRLLNVYLGHGMGSQLFQKVREEKGLAYSVFSSLNLHHHTGLMLFYVGTSRVHEIRCLKTIQNVIDDVREKGIPKDSLDLTKKRLVGILQLAAEDPEDRMNSIGQQELYVQQAQPLEEEIEKIWGTSKEEVRAAAETLFSSAETKITVGPKRAKSKK